MPDSNPFAAARDAHSALNPEPHIWAGRTESERFAIRFSHFENCETRAGKTVETLVGQLEDGMWAREWLFPPDNPQSRGWRAQLIEFIDEIRPELKPGDIVVLELGAERPTVNDPDRKTRPFSGSHHPAATVVRDEQEVDDYGQPIRF
jgi:hypothetical protein